MNCCVASTKHKYALDKPFVLEIWPIQVETNLIEDEIKFLEEVRFVFNRQQLIFHQCLFKRKTSIPINSQVDEMSCPTSHNGKVVCHIKPFKM